MHQVGAVLLAAGRGERLRPLTDTVPKPALMVGGKPLGAYGLAVLQEMNGRTAVNLSWLPEVARDALQRYAPADTMWCVELPTALGTAGTVQALLPHLAPTFVVMNADTITDLSISDLLASHQRIGVSATLAVKEVGEGADFATEGDRATGLIDRHRRPSESGALYVGVAVFERDRVAPLLLAAKPPAGLAEIVLGALATRGDLAIHRHQGLALDVGTPTALTQAEVLLAGDQFA